LHPQNDPWCNGSTPVFGIVSQGSSPCGSTKKLQLIEAFLFYRDSENDLFQNK
jgi:hypothetical protein